MLQKLESRTPDKFMAILWNPGGHTITIERNMTIAYAKESNYIKKFQIDQQESIRDVYMIMVTLKQLETSVLLPLML